MLADANTLGSGTMETRQRVFRSSALVWSLILVGCFVAFAGTAVFFAGSKSNPAFKFVQPTARSTSTPATNPSGSKSPTTSGQYPAGTAAPDSDVSRP
jgi:hypothetical protein